MAAGPNIVGRSEPTTTTMGMALSCSTRGSGDSLVTVTRFARGAAS